LCPRISMHTETLIVSIQVNMKLLRYQNDVNLLCLLSHIRANHFVLRQRITHHVMLLKAHQLRLYQTVSKKSQIVCKKMDLNQIDHIDLLTRKAISCNQILGSSRLSFIRFGQPFHNSIFKDTLYQ